jgi:beta-phosphoglucomutase-like phosphatase (HAD superfamily)/dTDP-glucose pyrophosphorylase
VIKLVIIDLDGCLIDAREIHYEALNLALPDELKISREDHLAKFDGLPTMKKLDMLGLHDDGSASTIWRRKQEATRDKICELIRYDKIKNDVFVMLQSRDIAQAVCSNSIRETIEWAMVKLTGVIPCYPIYGNDDVTCPKPSTEMYLKAMIDAGVDPCETLIIEDSKVGRQGAVRSGAHVLGVRGPHEVTKERIMREIDEINGLDYTPVPWVAEDLNVIIPMAGEGSRFMDAGYTFPKPLIDVDGKPMIQAVVENLNIKANYIFLVRKEHIDQYAGFKSTLNLIAPGCKIVVVDELTEGAACTLLLAEEHIDNDAPLLIANCDQLMGWDSSAFMWSVNDDNVDGSIITFENTHPKWSYAETDENGWVTRVAEKDPISNKATTGVYYWQHGSDFVQCARMMIADDVRVNGEFYTCPVFNVAIAEGGRIKTFHVEEMNGLGTPADLKAYLRRSKQ